MKEKQPNLRRKLLRWGALAGGVAVLAPLLPACREYWQSRALIEKDKLTGILEAMSSSGFPLLQKIARDINFLNNSQNNPQEFPNWVNEDSTPLVITHDDTPAALMEVGVKHRPDIPANQFLMTTVSGGTQLARKIDDVIFRIHLGTPSYLREQGSLAQGLFLAKSYLNIPLAIKMGLEFWDLIVRPGVTKITDVKGQPITNREEQIRIGMSVFFNQWANQGSLVWKVANGLPILMVGAAASHFVRNKQMPEEAKMGPVYLAVNHMNDNPPVFDKTLQIINTWVRNGTILPPDGITQVAFNAPLQPAILRLQNDIEKRWGTNQDQK